MKRLVAALLATCCSSPATVDAPELEPQPDALPACASITTSSCDSGFASCSIGGECWCYVGPAMIACAVPCPIFPSGAPSCHAVCDGFDTFECATTESACWCVPKDGGERVRCELERCG